MERINLFSPFYYKTNIVETEFLKQIHLEAMLTNYEAFPHHSHDWNVHTSYWLDNNEQLPYKINWEHFFSIYQHYIDQFCLEFFGAGRSWEITDNIWYNVYGKGQDGMQHNHIGEDFSAIHYFKFNPEAHTGTTFINPRINEVKYYESLREECVSKLNSTDPDHSLYQRVFTPQVNEGDFIIFPSHLDHTIYRNHSDELRVTIAMNFRING
jgi:uncharacterized protein YozE (UPF0346 family)